MPTFDKDNLIMTLDSGLTVFDWEYYYDEWKQWSLAHPDNRKCPPAFSSSGGEDIVTGQLNAGGYYFFRNDLGWRMRPFEENATMYATGNLIPQDSTLPIFVPTVGGYTVAVLGLQPITQSVGVVADSVNTFAGHSVQYVYVDTEELVDGDGTQGSPFNNITSAIDYAEANHLHHIHLEGDITLDRNLKNFEIAGFGLPVINFNGFDITGCRFYQVQLEGIAVGSYIAQECVLRTGCYLNGYYETCALVGDPICAPGGVITMTQCISAIAGLSRPTINMNAGNTCKLSVRKYGGGLIITNCDQATDEVTVESEAGNIQFAASCTNGSMVVRGSCAFDDQTAGATVTDQRTPRITWEALMEAGFTAEQIMRGLAAVLAGESSGHDTNNPIYMAANGSKPRIAATTDQYGNRLSVVKDFT